MPNSALKFMFNLLLAILSYHPNSKVFPLKSCRQTKATKSFHGDLIFLFAALRERTKVKTAELIASTVHVPIARGLFLLALATFFSCLFSILPRTMQGYDLFEYGARERS